MCEPIWKVESRRNTTKESNGKNSRCVMVFRNLLLISLAPRASSIVYLSLKKGVLWFSPVLAINSYQTVAINRYTYIYIWWFDYGIDVEQVCWQAWRRRTFQEGRNLATRWYHVSKVFKLTLVLTQRTAIFGMNLTPMLRQIIDHYHYIQSVVRNVGSSNGDLNSLIYNDLLLNCLFILIIIK